LEGSRLSHSMSGSDAAPDSRILQKLQGNVSISIVYSKTLSSSSLFHLLQFVSRPPTSKFCLYGMQKYSRLAWTMYRFSLIPQFSSFVSILIKVRKEGAPTKED
jgi:hypothetical protein